MCEFGCCKGCQASFGIKAMHGTSNTEAKLVRPMVVPSSSLRDYEGQALWGVSFDTSTLLSAGKLRIKSGIARNMSR
jgi:hypothetical protein